MRTALIATLALATLALAACSGPAATSGSGPATGGAAPAKVDPNLPKWKLGHFSTPDGMVGAVIDRSGSDFRVKMDKSDDVVALFMEKQKNFRGPAGNFLNGPAGKPWFFLSEGGTLAYIKPTSLSNLAYNIQKRRGMLPFNRDADASPLGPATKQGIAQPPPEKSPAEKYSDGLQARSVIARFPEFKPQDAGNLAKVEAALKKAKPDMFFHVVAAYAEQFRWAPASGLIDNTDHGSGGVLIQGRADDKWSPKAKGVKRYGISFFTGCQFNSPCRVRQLALKGWPTPLKENTVGVIWNVNGSFVTLVTLDGGRYRVGQWWGDFAKKGGPLKAGVPAQASWPAPLQHELCDLASIRLMAKGGAITKAEADAVASLEDAYYSCKKGVWKKGLVERDKIEASPVDANRKYGKLSAIAKKYEKLADRQCAKTVKAYEKGLIAFITARSAKRRALYTAVKGLAK